MSTPNIFIIISDKNIVVKYVFPACVYRNTWHYQVNYEDFPTRIKLL